MTSSILVLLSMTKSWLSSAFSLRNLAIAPSTILATISAGLPDLGGLLAGDRALALDQRGIELLAASAPAGWPRRCAWRAACRAPRARPCRPRSRARPARRSCRGRARPHCGRRRRRRPARPRARRRGEATGSRRSWRCWRSASPRRCRRPASWRGEQRLDVAAGLERELGDGADEILELLVLGDEVGLAELTSTTAPLLPATATPTRPSAAVRPAFLAAAARPLVRSQSIAASMSPLGLAQRLLAVHHAGAGALAQFLHGRGCDLRHVSILLIACPPVAKVGSRGVGSTALRPGSARGARGNDQASASAASAGGSSIAPISSPRAAAPPCLPASAASAIASQ